MDHPGKRSRKAQGKNYSNTSESETEEYEISLKKQQANQINDKSFLQKKRHSKEKEQKKKSPFLGRDTPKINEKRKYINKEKKRYSENDSTFDIQNLSNQNERIRYLEEMVQKLTEQNSIFKNQLEQNKIEFSLFQQKFEYQDFKLKEQKLSQKRLEEDNFRLQSSQKRLEEDNSRLQKSFNEKISIENSLYIKVDLLRDQVRELNEFHFQVKLRKLIKKLIKYLFDEFYPDYMFYNIITKKMKFEKFPLFLFDFKLEDRKIIIDILNELLDKIYARAQNNDCIVHFVDPRTENDPSLRRYIWVFKDDYAFFEYFHISEIGRHILLKIIPRVYFMKINNFEFDKSIKELMSIIERNTFYY